MRFILTPVGSEGDLYPFVALALLLKQRGHEVLLVHGEHFIDHLKEVDVPKKPLGSSELYLKMARNPDLWHPIKSLEVLGRSLGIGLEDFFKALIGEVKRSPCILISPTLGPAARIIQDLLGTKTLTVHLQPAAMPTVYEMPELSIGPWIKRAPKIVKSALYKIAAVVSDRSFGPPVNTLRKKLGLKPVENILLGWMNSPDGVLCLFPSWYGPKQPDWPVPLAHATFPVFDRSDVNAYNAEVESFFAEHRPIVVTHGTANFTASKFFEDSVLALIRSDRPAALLTREREQLPKYLPENIRHFTFLPFSKVLPMSSGIVHHGGMGTTVQALRAGCPQLIVPMAHDQFDNGARITRMGAGKSCPIRKYSSSTLSAWLDLVNSGSFREGAAVAASKVNQEQFHIAVVKAFGELGLTI